MIEMALGQLTVLHSYPVNPVSFSSVADNDAPKPKSQQCPYAACSMPTWVSVASEMRLATPPQPVKMAYVQKLDELRCNILPIDFSKKRIIIRINDGP